MGHFIVAAGVFDPIVGAGLPSLVISLVIAFGIYRMRKRHRRGDRNATHGAEPILETLSFDTDPAGAFLLSSPMAKQRQRTRPTDGPRQQLSPGARQLGSASSLEGLTPEHSSSPPTSGVSVLRRRAGCRADRTRPSQLKPYWTSRSVG